MLPPYTFTLADFLKWSEAYRGPKFHGSLSDPPYHLTEITDRFGAEDAAPAQYGSDGAFQRASRGFMGQTWDGGDVAFRPETWAALAEHLHPGAFGMAFASSRGWQRMAVAIEGLTGVSMFDLRDLRDVLGLALETRQWWIVEAAHRELDLHCRRMEAVKAAGLIIHPVVMCWSFGSGFPKATKPADQYVAGKLRAWLAEHPDALAELVEARQAIKTAERGQTTKARQHYQQTKLRLQEAAGLTRVAGQRKHAPKFAAAEFGYREKDNGFNSKERESFDVVEYLDPIAAALAGHRYGLQALKPALEPVIVYQKPYQGRAIDCITSTGAGALWVDGGRLPATDSQLAEKYYSTRNAGPRDNAIYGADRRERSEGPLEPHEGGRWPANLALVHHPACNGACHRDCPVKRMGDQSGESRSVGGSGEASRDWQRHGNTVGSHMGAATGGIGDTGTAARFFYNADWMHERLEMADQVGYFAKASTAEREAGLDPMQIALLNELADLELDELDETTVDDGRDTPIDNPYLRGETSRRNTHPTIKPLSLTRWLATLLLPPAMYGPRRLLVPFAGTGSEMIGGMLAGWEHVQGIELGEDHERIARARLAYWLSRRHEFMAGQPITVKAATKKQPAERTLFDLLKEEAA